MAGIFGVRGPVACDGRLSHIAFIMDGNGRWATRRALPREAGHAAGAKNLTPVLRACEAHGIPHVTVYAFSTENWKRPAGEVAELMRLMSVYTDDLMRDREKNRVHVRFIGDLAALSADMREKMERLEQATAAYPRTLNVAFNYGGRQEIVHAVNALIAQGKNTVTEADISARLYTAPIPDPDLVVRTGGDLRISNFLIWQSAYTEYAFTRTLWPDFGARELDRILRDFLRRNRRFGGL